MKQFYEDFGNFLDIIKTQFTEYLSSVLIAIIFQALLMLTW